MAVVKGLTLASLKTIGKLVTFSFRNGKLIAARCVGPLGPARTRPKQIVTRRMSAVNSVMKTFSKENRALYTSWAADSDYTWKDQYISTALAVASAQGQVPIVVTDFTHQIIGAQIALSFSFGNYIIVEDTGYGSLPYGSSPYGASSTFAGPDGAPLYTDYNVTFGHPTPRPRPKPRTTRSPQIECLQPVTPPTYSEDNSQTTPTQWLSVPATFPTAQRLLGNSALSQPCLAMEQQAWNMLMNNPDIEDLPLEVARIWTQVTTAPPNFQFFDNYYSVHADYNLDDYLTQATWPFVDDMKFNLSWAGSNAPEPWKNTATLDAVTKNLTFNDVDVHFNPGSWANPIALDLNQNNQQPASICPIAPTNTYSWTAGFHWLKLHVLEHTSQSVWQNNAPSLSDYTVRISQCPGHPPIICPPIQVN